MTNHSMERINELKWALTDQVMDLTTATEVFRDYLKSSSFDPERSKGEGVIRMCAGYAILNLAKLWETLIHYGKEINDLPESLKAECHALKKDLEDKKVYQFRSKYLAHPKDKDIGKPAKATDLQHRLESITGKTIGDFIDFCHWICPASEEPKEGSVVGIVVEVREYCRSLTGPTSRP